MSILGGIVKLFVGLGVFVARKLGINGILILVLLMELPLMVFYYVTMRYEYRQEHSYEIEAQAAIRPLSPEKDHLEREGVMVQKRQNYYLAELQVKNKYSNKIQSMSVTAHNQDGDLLACRTMRYYNDAAREGEEVIPAGATGRIPCLITLDRETIEATEEIIIEGWVFGEELDSARTVTVDFAPVKREQGYQ